MRPLAVGLDLVEIARVERMLERHQERMLRRMLTDEEREYCLGQAVPARHVAARLAAKEAAYKALADSVSVGAIGWQDVEVTREITGRPALVFKGRAAETAQRLGVNSTLVSLTHTDAHAAAVVVLFSHTTG